MPDIREIARPNATSGFLVFLIALPLCLGIAMASGFPPISGVLTAILGGLLVSHIGSAPLTIKGPAAGLIVITFGAVTELGAGDPVVGYHKALAVGVVAAGVQIVFAMVRAGAIAAVMPPSIVHGMLAAIGVIIIAKQTPVVMGVEAHGGEPLEMLAQIPDYLAHANPEVLLIGALSIIVLIGWPALKWKFAKRLPAPMVALALTIPIGALLGLSYDHDYVFAGHPFHVGPGYLVSLPGNLLDVITFPDFSSITSPASIKYVVMYALVGTIESLLSVIAVDSMDPRKRVSGLDRDLLATGIGNLVCSMIGGLPMISEIVRSKANIDAGASNRWSNWFHGLYLLLFVALLPGLLQMIPLATLAAMLVVTGANLAALREFKHAWAVGSDQFALFLVTFAVTLGTDLLIGVGAGLAVKLGLHVARGAPILQLIRPSLEVARDGDLVNVVLHGPASFSNLFFLRRELDAAVAGGANLIRLDFRDAALVDHTVQEKLAAAAAEWPSTQLEVIGLGSLTAVSAHEHATRLRSR